MSIERGQLVCRCKAGEDLVEALDTPWDLTGASGKLTFRAGPGELAAEVCTVSTADGTMTFSGGRITFRVGRAITANVGAVSKAVALTGDFLLVDSLGNSLYYFDVTLTVDPRSTVR